MPPPSTIIGWTTNHCPNRTGTPDPVLSCEKQYYETLGNGWTLNHCSWTGNSYQNVNQNIYWYCATDKCDGGNNAVCAVPLVRTLPTPANPNAGTPDCCTGNPINVGTGNKFQREQDYVDAQGSLKFERFYNSVTAFNQSLGVQWRHTYDTALTTTDSNTVTVWRPDGKSLQFNRGNTTVWISQNGVQYRLIELLNASGQSIGFQYIGPDNIAEYFDVTGRLTSIVYPSGQQVTLTYLPLTQSTTDGLTSNGPLVLDHVTDTFGRSLYFYYNASTATLSSVKLPDATLLQFTYDTSNNLSTVQYPDGHIRTYAYDEKTNGSAPSIPGGSDFPNALTGIIDENNNRFATWKYDAQGRAVSSEHDVAASGGATLLPVESVSITYNSDGSATTLDALNTTHGYTFTTKLGAIKNTGISQPCSTSGCSGTVSNAMAYDNNGNISSRTDFNGNKTTYIYDLARNLETSRTEGLTNSGATTAQTRTITTTWHPNFRLIKQRAEPLKITTYIYNDAAGGAGNCAPVSTIPVLCQKTEQATTDATGAAGLSATTTGTSRTWSYTYNSLGQVLTADGPRTDVNDVTTYTYYTSASNTSGSVHSIGDLATVTNAVGLVTQITNYDLNGRPLKIIDPNNVTTTLTYSPRGWLKSRTVNGAQTTNYDYDGVGQLTKVTLPDGSYLNYLYDTAHRLTDITDNQGNKIEYGLDAMGNRTSDVTYDPSGNLTRALFRQYDALNRLQQTIGGAGIFNEITQYTYDNNSNLKTITDPLNHVTTNGYDALNRLITVTDPANGVTTTNYNALDQITSVADPRLVTTNYTIDGLGNVTLTQSPDSGNTNNVYDAAGNVIQKTDARGIVSTYTYDALNRLTSITYPTSTSENVTFTYDDTVTRFYRKGRLKSVATNNVNTLTFIYDAYGNIVSQADLSATMWGVSQYQYDSANRVSQITYPSGRIVIYTRNALGQITQVQTKDNASAALQTIISSASYEPFGPLNSLSFANGVTTTLQHDFDYRVGRITTTSTPTWDYVYSYDAASNLTGMTDQIGTVNKTYGYDTLNRLTTDTSGTTSFTYQYDAGGNRTQLKIGTGTIPQIYATTSNRLTTYSGSTINSDANGNTTNRTSITNMSYNNANRLSQATASSTTTSYQYSGLGWRNLKTGTKTIHYDYLPDGKTLSQMQLNTDGSYNTAFDYVWLDDTPIAQIKTVYTTNNTVSTRRLTYIHVDHLNTPRLMTDANKTVVWKWSADAYGLLAPNTNPDGDSIVDTLDLRYPGQVADAETGLFYNLNRYFDPAKGGYTQSDPIGLRGGNNTYEYVNGNPVSFTDPTGLMGQGPSGANGWTPPPRPKECGDNPKGCADPITITWPNGTGAGVAKTYSLRCLLGLAIVAKPVGIAAGNGIAGVVESGAARAAAAADAAGSGAGAAAARGIGAAAGVFKAPGTSIILAPFAVNALFEECECQNK